MLDAIRTKATFFAGVFLFAVGSTALAHTTILNQMTEGTSADNALKIGHGCAAPSGNMIGVVAQSAVWPTMNPQVTASDGSAIADLSQVIVQGTLAGLLSPIQNRDIFQQQQLKLDSLGNKIGFSGTKGNLIEPGWLGRVPWQFAPPKFVSSSCAARLLIKVAIADICIRQIGGYDKGYVNMWIPDNGSMYAQAAHAAGNDEGVGAPATLTINRNLATNPLSPACGAGMDVTVTPSPDDVDTNLPIPGYWE